jgi:competence protein ComEA
MFALTPSERRGAVAVLVILALGTARDLWTVWHPEETPPPFQSAAPAPVPDPEAPPSPPSDAAPPGVTAAAALDLNRATEQELDGLPGIGPVLAARITAHRTHFGPFRRVEDLLAIQGIGPKVFERLKPRVKVADAVGQGR